MPTGVASLPQRVSTACETAGRVDSSRSITLIAPLPVVDVVGRALNQVSAEPASHKVLMESNLSRNRCDGRFGGWSLVKAKQPSRNY